MIRTIVLVTLAIGASYGADVRPVALSQRDFAVPVIIDGGTGFLPARDMILDVTSKNPKLKRSRLAVVYDPHTTVYAWLSNYVLEGDSDTPRYSDAFASSILTYSGEKRLALFWLVSPRLVVVDSAKTAKSLDDAVEKALKEDREIETDMEFSMTHPQKEQVTWKRLKFVSFGSLGEDFFTPPLSAISGRVRLLDFQRKDGHFEATIQGQWKERIIFDDDYKVIANVRLN